MGTFVDEAQIVAAPTAVVGLANVNVEDCAITKKPPEEMLLDVLIEVPLTVPPMELYVPL